MCKLSIIDIYENIIQGEVTSLWHSMVMKMIEVIYDNQGDVCDEDIQKVYSWWLIE